MPKQSYSDLEKSIVETLKRALYDFDTLERNEGKCGVLWTDTFQNGVREAIAVIDGRVAIRSRRGEEANG